MSDPTRPRVVTISSTYGTGDVVIGRRLAERLGVAFLDREIPAFVAEQMDLPETAAASYDERPRGAFDRLIDSLARAPVVSQPWSPERLDADERRYKIEVERLLARTAASGGVILGRGGAVVLGSLPGALHVRLAGPRAARLRRVMEWEGLDEETAERRLVANDRARVNYGRKLYGVDPGDGALYHLVIDSTAFDLATCVDRLAAASDARARGATAAPD
jgi:cytidylate kinase